MSESARREFARFAAQGKQLETRRRRAYEIAERLMLVMEAEQEPPSILQLEFARNPKARAGWDRMPPSHKRAHLYSIFYYKQPESRARRVAKAVEMMMEYAERKRSPIE